MSDFLLDFRPPDARHSSAVRAASLLKFTGDVEVQTIERERFSLVLSRSDGFGLWGPCERRTAQGNVLVVLAGRIALDEREWDEAGKMEGPGGLACKAIAARYLAGGAAALGTLNGNFAVFVYDERTKKFYIVTDRCGMFLVYRNEASRSKLIFSSHPDVLASVSGEDRNWDMASLAEFLMTSRLSCPKTYYRNVQVPDRACVFTIAFPEGGAVCESKTEYFRFDFKIEPKASEDELAGELATAFKNAVRRRTLPLFGRTGIGLSGGLDSRAILSAADPRSDLRAFTLFDEENAEFKTAKAIAKACDVEMIPLQRDFEYYGNSAELGVAVSAGTGCISCNHMLGARDRLKAAGITNLLTGCYCDYIFKGLAFNRREKKLSSIEELDGFQFEFYDSFHWLKTPWREEIMSRLNAQFPESGRDRLSDEDWLEVERKRTFPLAYEQDLAQRVIPQRLMPWYVPVVDNDLIDVYLKLPPRFKLNASVFRKMLNLLCPEKVLSIPDSNTRAAINASWPASTVHRYVSSVRNRIEEKVLPQMATSGSWPNWRHYLRHSPLIASLWNRPNETAREIFTTILGNDPFATSISDYAAGDIVLFQRLFTQKLWLDQRAS